MRITVHNAINLLLGLLSIVVVFHILIILKVIPYNITWGGRLNTDEQMYWFEAVSILINLFLGFILLVKGRYIKFSLKEKTLNIVLWIFLIQYILNTIGNIIAQTSIEKIFALLTLIFASLIWVILRNKTSKL